MPQIALTKERQSVIEKYISDYPYLSNNKLATLIKKENALDVTKDSLRQLIPQVKSNLNKPKYDMDESDLVVPGSWYEERPQYQIPTAVRKLLVISDSHIPFHDVQAIKTALEYGELKKVDGILLNGDIADFYSVSRFIRLPNLRNFKKELDVVKLFLENLRKRYPNYKIFYKAGNHEARLEKYIIQNAPDLFGLTDVQLPDILGLRPLRIEYIDERTIMNFGKLSIAHGSEIFGGGINVARNFRIKSRVSILFSHFHRYQTDVVPTLDGKHQGGWSVGCTCGLRPDYMPVNDWVHGCAIIERDKDGYFVVKNKQIMSGRII